MAQDRNVPKHVAIIMDGNGRWAEQKGLQRTDGHKVGAKAVQPIIEAAFRSGVQHLTLWAFSSDNWKRPENEVSTILRLISSYLLQQAVRLAQENIRFNFIGEVEGLPRHLRVAVRLAENQTKEMTGPTLSIALNYGGRADLLRCYQRMLAEGIKDPTADDISRHLSTGGLPDPDLIIRTGGEHRTSGFMVWEAVHSEWVFFAELWPDFSPEHFHAALREYQKRQRRFGGLTVVPKSA